MKYKRADFLYKFTIKSDNCKYGFDVHWFDVVFDCECSMVVGIYLDGGKWKFSTSRYDGGGVNFRHRWIFPLAFDLPKSIPDELYFIDVELLNTTKKTRVDIFLDYIKSIIGKKVK